MTAIKTQLTDGDVNEFISSHAGNEQQKHDSFQLLELMKQVSGFEPRMWGTSIIGFGKYHFRSERSKRSGDWFVIGFSPRKAALSLYIYAGLPAQETLLPLLGKFTMGKGCIYVKKMTDINQDILARIMEQTIEHITQKFGLAQ